MSEGRPPNRRQLQAAATRERVLAAAGATFEAQGYRATTVGAITDAADIAHGTFYLYFRNKDDAFAQVIAGVGDELRSAQRARLSPDRHEGVAGVLRGFLGVFVEHPGLWRALLEGMLVSPAVEQLWHDLRSGFVDRIAHRLSREQEAGVVRPLDPRQAALALASMAEWYAFTQLVLRPAAASSSTTTGDGEGDGGRDAVGDAVATLTDLWYHAVYGEADTDRLATP